jgi:hypothetical protein
MLADEWGRVALALVVGARLLALLARFPHQVAIVLGVEVVTPAPVADVADHLVPIPVDVLALRQIQVGHGTPPRATVAAR